MGRGPSSPWRKLDDGEEPIPLGAYDAAPHLFKYATLYRAVAEASGGAIGPDAVDQWETWQAGSYLGVGLPVPDEAAASATAGRNPAEVAEEKSAYFEAVQRARAEGAPPPEPPPSLRPRQRAMPEGVARIEDEG